MIFPRCHCLVVSLSSSSHWLEKKKSFLPWRSVASTEGSRGDVGKVPEQVAAAGVIGERWQGHRVCCWQAVGNQSSGTTESRGNAEMVARDGGGGRTDCHHRMTGTPWTSTNRDHDERGSGGLQPQSSLGGSHGENREACGSPADAKATQSSLVRRPPIAGSHRGEV